MSDKTVELSSAPQRAWALPMADLHGAVLTIHGELSKLGVWPAEGSFRTLGHGATMALLLFGKLPERSRKPWPYPASRS